MVAGDRMTEVHDCSGDAAACVLGALDADEAEAFRAHMSGCVVCRDEVAALQPVADALPMAAPQYSPPRGLRRRVLREARAEAHAGREAPWSRIGIRAPMLGLALAVVLAFAIVGVVKLASSGSAGVRVIPAHVLASTASAELRLSGGRGELVVRHLPQPPAGHIYEVWLKRAGAPPSPTSTLFSVTSGGNGAVGVSGSLSGISEVLVTPEPMGGSSAPTHAPVIVAQLT
jgi:anti-sigma-K factor RskA